MSETHPEGGAGADEPTTGGEDNPPTRGDDGSNHPPPCDDGCHDEQPPRPAPKPGSGVSNIYQFI